jgi:P27 family predicted phage terminase small subunit
MKKPTIDGDKQPAVTATAPVAHQKPIAGMVPPAHLSGEALDEWARVVAILFERGVLDKLDASALADFAECYGRLRECEAEISARGVLVGGRDGNLVRNPAIMAAKGYRDAMLRWSKLFGVTIGARKQVAIPGERAKEPNRFQDLAAQIRRVK